MHSFKQYKLQGHHGSILSLNLRSDGKQLASGGDDGVKIWDLATQSKIPAPAWSELRGPTTKVLWIKREDDDEALLLFGTGHGFIGCWREATVHVHPVDNDGLLDALDRRRHLLRANPGSFPSIRSPKPPHLQRAGPLFTHNPNVDFDLFCERQLASSCVPFRSSLPGSRLRRTSVSVRTSGIRARRVAVLPTNFSPRVTERAFGDSGPASASARAAPNRSSPAPSRRIARRRYRQDSIHHRHVWISPTSNRTPSEATCGAGGQRYVVCRSAAALDISMFA
ncbi:WD-REPEATS-REGION domain-containing protein [Mycena kentingensis (nom. inval.)]|nr:WD-REPEATS-REGION domain-containing protein [Mycena kentingensis (nom. inval.)]